MEAELLTDLFGVDIDIDVNVKPKERTGGTNCAAYLEKPELDRNSSNFVGLFNQGGTCYMNSLIQSLFMNPLFRNAIYSIPLCENDLSNPLFHIKGQKFDVLLALQKLLIELERYQVRAITTKNLTKALGWDSSEGRDQHDVQELNRILFDLLERALYSTPYDGLIADLYKGVYFQQTSCSVCHKGNKTEAEFLDLILQVKDFTRIEDSLNAYFSTEIINDYKCDNCDKRLDLHKFQKIKRAPPLLTLALFRIGYDYMKDERFKLTSRMEFPLELDLTEYFDEDYKNKDDNKYELYSIIIHRGNANQGHYFSYTRDLLKEGNHDLKPLTEFRKEPLIIEKEVKKEEDIKKSSEKEKIIIEDTNKQEGENDKKKNLKGTNKESKKKEKALDKQNQAKNNEKQKKNKNENYNQGSKKQQKKFDEEYSKLNYDECDHPIKYSNRNLASNWFQFDDTSITPIRIGRLQKQFQSSESAYILMYVKQGMEFQQPSPPDYLVKYIEEENRRIQEQRRIYQEEESSLVIHLYESTNFFVDNFKILTIKEGMNIDKTDSKFSSKIKFMSKLEELLVSIQSYYLTKYKITVHLNDIILYDIIPKKENNSLIVLKRIDMSDTNANLETLKFSHEGSYMIINRTNSDIDLNIIDKQIGSDFEPIEINIIYQGSEYRIKTFTKTSLLEFKDFLTTYFDIQYEFYLYFLSNSKAINIDQIALDKKNKNVLNVGQLRLSEKSHVFISVRINMNKKNESSEKGFQQGNDEKVNCIIKFEDSDESKVITTRLNKTFEQFFQKLRKKLLIEGDFRIRRLLNGFLIYKDEWNKTLSSDPEFVEGGVRLQVEYGECYNKNEILVKMLVEISCEKVYKEFIGEDSTTLSQLKTFICKELNIKQEEYTVNKTSYLKDPIKVYKNENETLKKLGIKDGNLIYFENISQQLYEKYLIKIFLDSDTNEKLTYIPLNIETTTPAIEITISKDENLFDLKQSIIEKLYLESNIECNITINKIRLRVISKKGEAERILRGNSNPIKKLRIDNPCCLLLEQLNLEEDLGENTLQLYLFERDSKKSTYVNKKSILFTYQNTASSNLLYDMIRSEINLKNITIAKHTKSYYNWEIIPEMENDQPINLKKSNYNLKDGDWIGVRNDDIDNAENDDMQTEEDRKMLEFYKKLPQTEAKGGKKSRVLEKPLRFKTNF